MAEETWNRSIPEMEEFYRLFRERSYAQTGVNADVIYLLDLVKAQLDWIPVTSAMPDDRVRVLVLNCNGYVEIAEHSPVKQWSTDSGLFYHSETYAWIVAWKPLPAGVDLK